MVKSGRRCNGKIITFIAVPFGVYTVQGKRNNGNYIGFDGFSGPCRVYFTAGNIFYIIGKWNVVVRCCRVGWDTVMDNNGFGYHNTVKNNFTGVFNGFYLGLRNFWRIVAD